MPHTVPARLQRAAVLTTAVATGMLTTISPADAVVGDPAADGTYTYTTVWSDLRRLICSSAAPCSSHWKARGNFLPPDR